MEGLSSVLTGGGGGRALANAGALVVVLGFLRWLIPFVFTRLDVSRGHLGQRLKFLEAELDSYREVAMLMIGVVAKSDPGNPALIIAAQLLRQRAPRQSLELDELIARLASIPDAQGGHANVSVA